MTKALEDIRKQLRDMTEAEIVEMISAGRRDKNTQTVEKMKAIRQKTKVKNLSAALDSLSDEQLLRMVELRKAQQATKEKV